MGLAFASASNSFHVLEAGPGAAPATTEVVRLTPFALTPGSDRAGSAQIAAAVGDPINTAFDVRRNRLLLLGAADRLLEVQAGPSGELDPATLSRRDAQRFDLRDPQGMAVDPVSGTLYVLDAAGPRIVRVEPDSDGSFAEATISEIDLRASGFGAVRGLAFDSSTGHLHLRSGQELYELTAAAAVVAVRDLSPLGLVSPEGMAFAPSGDQTDDPARLSVYVADSARRQARQSAPAASAAGPGEIVELSLAALAAPEAIDFISSLVRTVDMGAASSPDPSGLAYLPAPANKLVMVDGEVEETVSGITHFQGANLWEMTLGGSVLRSANISKIAPVTVNMSNEPTGIAWNPGNGHYYISDDSALRVFDLNPGGDGLPGTSDDSYTSFLTSTYGGGDPEGVAYDPLGGRIFVADGVNQEIYVFSTTGSLLGQFDVHWPQRRGGHRPPGRIPSFG